MSKYWLGFCAMLFSGMLAAQSQMPEVEMADAMRENGKIYVVVAVLCVLFVGITLYLISIDRKLRKLEKEA
ncbi:CcmD family protein [Owenweeksia hongkongensis]|uniref:CcmD family protein n=1 Tax=Owenweeksia hongkongensis TaxID=253245 RepID=UPI003A91395F